MKSISEWWIPSIKGTPESNVHAANMGPTWVLSAPGGPHVDRMSLAIRDSNVENASMSWRQYQRVDRICTFHTNLWWWIGHTGSQSINRKTVVWFIYDHDIRFEQGKNFIYDPLSSTLRCTRRIILGLAIMSLNCMETSVQDVLTPIIWYIADEMNIGFN